MLCWRKELDISLNGKRALITGSSRGIGRGIALKLAEHGVKVAVHFLVSRFKPTYRVPRRSAACSRVAVGSAKAALDSLVRYFAVTLAPRGITVNGISPGGVFGPPNVIEGGVLRVLPQEVQDAIRASHEGGWTPMGRLGTPADIGNAVMLLCMDEASFITGQIRHVDGGASIMDTVLPLDIQRG